VYPNYITGLIIETNNSLSYIKGEVYLTADHENPEGDYKYNCTLSSTSALGGVGGQGHAPTALPLGKRAGIQEAGWAPGPIWTGAENLAHIGIRFPNRPAYSE
jgi:hypothetical protein